MAAVYSASRGLFVNPLFLHSLTVVYLATMLLASLRSPRLPRARALRNAFVAFLCVNACYYVYYFVVLRYLDPGLVELQSELLIESARGSSTAAPGQLADDPAYVYSPDKIRPTLGGTLLSYAWSAILGAAFSFLLSFLVGAPDDAGAAPPSSAAGAAA